MLIDELIDMQKVNIAIELLKDRIDNIDTNNDKNNRTFADKLMKIYYDESMVEEYLDVLYKIFYIYNKYDLTIFKKIKELYSKEDWQVESKKIIERVENEVDYYNKSNLNKLYIEEELFDKLFISIKNDNMNDVIQYEKYLLPKYNDELIDIYIEQCKKLADRANNRKLYSELAHNLTYIKNMDNSKAKFDSALSEIREVHKGKPVMQEELQKL